MKDFLQRLRYRGIEATPEQARVLLRAQIELHRWSELECGDGNAYASWSIERDEKTGTPYKCVYPHKGESYRISIQDKETLAMRRVKNVCEQIGIHYYQQTDPRGCALWVSKEPIKDHDYTNGVACCD